MANENRPPFVSFEVRAVEDRAESLKAGVYMTRDVDFIRIVPSGSEGKTVLEYNYEEWLARTKPQTGEFRASGASADTPAMGASRFPIEWLRRIEQEYAAWKEGRELPVEGTPIRNWPVIGPSALKNCEAMHIRSVEELAHAADDTVASLGMGGVILRQRARDWLAAKHGDAGALSAKLEAVTAEAQAKDDRIKSLEQRLAALETKKAA